MSSAVSEMKETVVIVHGTFAKEADWVLPDGEFAQRLKAGLRNAEFKAFRWSGRNSHPARISAGKELAAFLKELRRSGHGPFHLIGHSHGGNVILYALRERFAVLPIASAVFLGTPFFQIAGRNVERIVKPAASIAGWVSLAPAVFLTLGPGIYFMESSTSGNDARGVGALLLGIPAMLIYGWFVRPKMATAMARRATEWLSRKQAEIDGWVRTGLPACPTFVAKVSGDEAGFHLSAVDFLSKLPWMLHRFARQTVGWVYAATVFAALTVENYDAITPVMLLVAGGWCLLLVGPIFGMLWSAAWRGNPLTFGAEGVFTAITVRVAPSTRPPWSRIPGDFEASFEPSKKIRGYKHCFFYQDETVADEISRWISGLPSQARRLKREAWSPPKQSRWWVGPLTGLITFAVCMAILHGQAWL